MRAENSIVKGYMNVLCYSFRVRIYYLCAVC